MSSTAKWWRSRRQKPAATHGIVLPHTEGATAWVVAWVVVVTDTAEWASRDQV